MTVETGGPVDTPTPDSSGGVESVTGAPLTGRRVRLRVPLQADLDFMYELSTSEEIGFRWSYRGRIPSPQEFFHDLWNDALAQFIVSTTDSDQALGVVRIYGADFENGTAKIAPVVAPSASMGIGAEAGLLIVNYAFWNWDFRKLYIEVPSYALELMGRSAQDRVAQEACLREHDYHQGRYWDRHVFALYREDFQEVPDRLWGRLLYESDQAG